MGPGSLQNPLGCPELIAQANTVATRPPLEADLAANEKRYRFAQAKDNFWVYVPETLAVLPATVPRWR